MTKKILWWEREILTCHVQPQTLNDYTRFIQWLWICNGRQTTILNSKLHYLIYYNKLYKKCSIASVQHFCWAPGWKWKGTLCWRISALGRIRILGMTSCISSKTKQKSVKVLHYVVSCICKVDYFHTKYSVVFVEEHHKIIFVPIL